MSLRTGRSVGFAPGAYDAAKPLVIDPVLDYSGYAGGSSDDQGLGIAVDGAGNAYITGKTLSTDYPVQRPALGGLFFVLLGALAASRADRTTRSASSAEAATAVT